MKQFILYALVAIGLSNYAHGQTTEWKVSGNSVNTDSRLGTNSQYDLILETANQERLRITKEGYVGIGINLPQYPLDVSGDAKMAGNLYMPNLASPVFGENSILTIDNNGRVMSKEMRGAGSGASLLQDMYSVQCFPFTNMDGTIMQYPAPSWSSVGGDQDNSSKLYTGAVCPALVGIGTSTPNFMLDVNGYTRINKLGLNANPTADQVLKIGVSGTTSDGILVDFNSSNDNKTAIKINAVNGNDKILEFNNSTLNRTLLSLNGQGQMVLQSTAPTNSIFTIKDNANSDVLRMGTDGIIWSTEVNVALKQDFPDYVFCDDYRLMSIHDLRCYLEQEQHLPNVPSAEEVAKAGMNLGEMQRIQMEKTEENTLYILQLEDRLKKLEEQNDQMAKLIEALQNK